MNKENCALKFVDEIILKRFCLYNKVQRDLCEVGHEPVRVIYIILVLKVLITPGYHRSATHFNAFRGCFISRCIDRYLRLTL